MANNKLFTSAKAEVAQRVEDFDYIEDLIAEVRAEQRPEKTKAAVLTVLECGEVVCGHFHMPTHEECKRNFGRIRREMRLHHLPSLRN